MDEVGLVDEVDAVKVDAVKVDADLIELLDILDAPLIVRNRNFVHQGKGDHEMNQRRRMSTGSLLTAIDVLGGNFRHLVIEDCTCRCAKLKVKVLRRIILACTDLHALSIVRIDLAGLWNYVFYDALIEDRLSNLTSITLEQINASRMDDVVSILNLLQKNSMQLVRLTLHLGDKMNNHCMYGMRSILCSPEEFPVLKTLVIKDFFPVDQCEDHDIPWYKWIGQLEMLSIGTNRNTLLRILYARRMMGSSSPLKTVVFYPNEVERYAPEVYSF